MSKLLPWWFPELSPDKQVIYNWMRDLIRENYEKYWYINIETPAVELNSVLTSKWGNIVSKQIYWLYWLKQWPQDLKSYSLHFDLTVPFARYVVDNESKIKFPFKRYQIQKVWRWERQKKARYKEFTQADIDVIWEKLPISYDSEVIQTLYKTLLDIFNFLKINNWIEVHINNKKFIEWICEQYWIIWDNKIEFFELLDSFYKIENTEFVKKLSELVWQENLNIVLNLLNTDINNLDINLKWVSDLVIIFNNLKRKWVNVIFDPYITRWLDYYTWTVFETFISNYNNFWSICSWWRYDNLVDSIRNVSNKWNNQNKTNYDWVWWSIWLSRLFWWLDDDKMINKLIPLTNVMLFNIWWNTIEYREKIADLLRDSWISTDVYYPDEKLNKQFSYAESKNIPLWIFSWETEQLNNQVVVKNLFSREQENVEIWELSEYIRKKLLTIV